MKTEALNSHKVNKGTMPKNGVVPLFISEYYDRWSACFFCMKGIQRSLAIQVKVQAESLGEAKKRVWKQAERDYHSGQQDNRW